MDCITEIRSYIEKNFSEKRKVHTEGVLETALKLAEIYGEDKHENRADHLHIGAVKMADAGGVT